MHTYLALIDPMLFTLLKTIRRAFEPHRSLEWYITGDVAMYLYAYSSGLPSSAIGASSLDIRVVVDSVEDMSHFEGVLEELLRHGFRREGAQLDLHYPTSTVHVAFSMVDKRAGEIVWLRNAKGKHTYPLLSLQAMMEQAQLTRLPLAEQTRQLELQGWMKEVMSRLIIE